MKESIIALNDIRQDINDKLNKLYSECHVLEDRRSEVWKQIREIQDVCKHDNTHIEEKGDSRYSVCDDCGCFYTFYSATEIGY